MDITDLSDEREAAPENIGAGLRSAREAAGYSVADVAERMRLSRHYIEDLEAERFDLFPVAVFLRGYLTNYARLLGIDAGPLLEAYDRQGFGPPQLHTRETDRTTARGSEFTFTVATLVLIAALIALSALWWREQWTENAGRLTTAPGVEHADEAGETGVGDAGLGEPTEPPAPADGTTVRAPPEPEAAQGDSGDESLPAPDRAERDDDDTGPDAVDPARGVPAPGADAEATAGAAAGPDADSERTADAPDRGTETVPVPADPVATGLAAGGAGEKASLVIRVHEDCWLMIRDAEQRLVYRDLAFAGMVLELSALPPVRVVAGYASGIEIEYDGEPIDLAPYVEQDTGTARLRLGF